jgi:hypothetical protein
MANVKVRVGQQPAVKVLTSGTISAVPSLGSLTDVSISVNINIDGGVY